MDMQRPNPDVLLKRVQTQEARQLQGKLKVFFGANPGVGPVTRIHITVGYGERVAG